MELLAAARDVLLARHDEHRETGLALAHRSVQLLPRLVLGELAILGLEDDLADRGAGGRVDLDDGVPLFRAPLAGLVADVEGGVAATVGEPGDRFVHPIFEATALPGSRLLRFGETDVALLALSQAGDLGRQGR